MAARTPEHATQAPDVPTTEPGLNMLGHSSLRSKEGRGVVNGRPYGEQLDAEQRALVNQSRWKFFPGAAARLRSATRQALGR